MLNPRMRTLVLMIAGAALTRLLPHPPNMTSITALALFGGATLGDRRLAFGVPLAALLLGDLALGFYADMPVQYLAFALVVALGMGLRGRRTVGRVAGATLAGSSLFFVVSNFGVWALGSMYPHSAAGLAACYVAALPFFGNALAGDALYATLLFGGLHLLEARFAALREPPVGAALRSA